MFSLPISRVMIERIYTLSYYHHHQIGSVNYYPLFRLGHETMGCAVKCARKLRISVPKLCLKFTCVESQPHLAGDNEFKLNTLKSQRHVLIKVLMLITRSPQGVDNGF